MLAGSPGDKSRTAPPECRGSKLEMTAWVEMLARIGQKNTRLFDVVGRDIRPRAGAPRGSGATILRELERERSRIARDLHAGAGQPLAGIKLNLDILGECAGLLPEAGREALARLQTLAAQAMEQVRAVSHNLHPPEWQGLPLAEALRGLVQSSGLADGMEVRVDIPPLPVEPSHAVKVALYRCAQECISNVLRHSGATRFELVLRLDGPMIELCFEDNGRGFPEQAPAGTGIGLRAIRRHASALGGVCDISNAPGGGVRIAVRLPVAAD